MIKIKQSKKLYGGSLIVEIVSILLALACTSLPIEIYFSYLPNLNPLLLFVATIVFLIGILCIIFGRSAEKSETWFHNVSLVFSSYEKAKAGVA